MRRKNKNMAKNEEYQNQKAVVQWFRLQFPNKLLNADTGGVWTRNIATAMKNKVSGHSNGYPDLFIPEPTEKYKGLFIEMKSAKGYPTPEQKFWISELNKRNYKVVICHSFNEAKNVIDGYFS